MQGVVDPRIVYSVNENSVAGNANKLNSVGIVPDSQGIVPDSQRLVPDSVGIVPDSQGLVPDSAGLIPKISYIPSLTQQQNIIMMFVEEHDSISAEEASKLLQVKPRRARVILNEIIAAGYLKKQGAARSTVYKKTKEGCV